MENIITDMENLSMEDKILLILNKIKNLEKRVSKLENPNDLKIILN